MFAYSHVMVPAQSGTDCSVEQTGSLGAVGTWRAAGLRL